MRRWRERRQIQGAGWRRLDNTGKLFAMVTGEDLSNVFRVSAVLDREISPECLQRALMRTLPEFEVFCVRLRRGFFWYYFETNTREPSVEQETAFICRYIEPLGNQMYPFRVSYFGSRINFEVFHALTDGMGAMNFLKRLVEIYLEENLRRENTGAGPDESGKEQEPVPGTASAVTGSAADGPWMGICSTTGSGNTPGMQEGELFSSGGNGFLLARRPFITAMWIWTDSKLSAGARGSA